MKAPLSPITLVLAHPALFDRLEIDAYEREVLSNPRATEHDASRFFANYPKFLFLGKGSRVRREVVFLDATSGRRSRVDFFRQNYGEAYWDIIELKSPGVESVTRPDGDHPRPSGAVYDALNQAEDYRSALDADPQARAKLLEQGINVYHPQILVVVGRTPDNIEPEVMRDLFDRTRRGPTEFRTYDDLHRFATDHYASSHLIVVPATIEVLKGVSATDDGSGSASMTVEVSESALASVEVSEVTQASLEVPQGALAFILDDPIRELISGDAMSPTFAAALLEALAVECRFEAGPLTVTVQSWRDTTTMSLTGSQPPATVRSSWTDPEISMEYAGYALALLALRTFFRLQTVTRSRSSRGFDFFLRSEDAAADTVDLLFNDTTRVEVSVIRTGDPVAVRQRLQEKRSRRASAGLAGLVVVVELSEPSVTIERA
jgi:hypothetical protein